MSKNMMFQLIKFLLHEKVFKTREDNYGNLNILNFAGISHFWLIRNSLPKSSIFENLIALNRYLYFIRVSQINSKALWDTSWHLRSFPPMFHSIHTPQNASIMLKMAYFHVKIAWKLHMTRNSLNILKWSLNTIH